MSEHRQHATGASAFSYEELAQLFSEPFALADSFTKEGQTMGLRMIRQPQQSSGTTDLVVNLFPLTLPSPQADEAAADQVALDVFLKNIQDPQFTIRTAACEVLGQLGNPAARPSLEAALEDEHRLVRLAAEKALAVLDTPRVQPEELTEIRILLWQQVKHLWKPLGTAITNQRGEAVFTDIPRTSTEAVFRVQSLAQVSSGENSEDSRPTLTLQAERPTDEEFVPEVLAADSLRIDTATLPVSERFPFEDGTLISTIYKNDEDQIIIEFRTQVAQLTNGCIHISAANQVTQVEELSEIIPLQANSRGVLTGSLVLSAFLDLNQTHTISFEPIAPPQENA